MKKNWKATTVVTASILVAVVSLTFALAGGGSTRTTTTTIAPGNSKVIDTTYVARAIQSSIKQQRNLTSEVRCPPSEPRTVGATFSCDAITHRLKAPHSVVHTPFVVTVKTTKGYATYVGK